VLLFLGIFWLYYGIEIPYFIFLSALFAWQLDPSGPRYKCRDLTGNIMGIRFTPRCPRINPNSGRPLMGSVIAQRGLTGLTILSLSNGGASADPIQNGRERRILELRIEIISRSIRLEVYSV
jgi:hypothetical protein